MANIIEILIAAKDEASATLNRVASETAGFNMAAAASITGISAALLTYGAVAAAALVAATVLTKSFIDQAESLELMKSRTGISIENIQILQQALKSMGLSADAGTTALTFLTRAIGDHNPLLRELGITTHDTWTAFNQLMTLLKDSSEVPVRNAVAFKLMGRSSGELMEAVDRLSDSMKRSKQLLTETGDLMDEAMVKKAIEAKQNVVELDAAIHAMQINLGTVTTPVIADFARGMSAFASDLRGLKRDADDTTAALITMNVELRKQPAMLSSHGETAPIYGGMFSTHEFSDGADKATDSTKKLQAALDATSAEGKKFSETVNKVMLSLKGMEQSPETMNKLAEGFSFTRVEVEKLLKIFDESTVMRIAKAKKDMLDLLFAPTPIDFGNLVKQPTRGQLYDIMNEFTDPDSIQARRTGQAQALADAKKNAGDILSAYSQMSSMLSATFQALQSSLTTFFQTMLIGGQGFQAALINVFKILVDSIIKELSALLAAQGFKLLLSFLGVPAIPISLPISPIGETPIPAGTGARGISGGNTFIIQSIDSKSALQAIMAPTGSIRRANDRISEISRAT